MYSWDQRFNAQSTVNFGGNEVDLPDENWLFYPWVVTGCETGPRVMELAKANSGFNAPNVSLNCKLDYNEKHNCCNAYWRHPVAINPKVSVNAAAVSDWFRSVTCAKRRQSPALRRTGWVSGFGLTSGPPALWAPALRLVSILSGGMSPVFRPGHARPRKSIDMDCRIFSDSFWNPSGGTIYCPDRSVEQSRSTLGLREYNRADYSHPQRRLNRR